MAYVPPSLRKEKTVDQKKEEAMKIVQDASDKHFPVLGDSAPIVSRSTIAYGEKAKEWEQKRIETEIRERVDARMAEIREEKRKQELESSIMPNFNRKREAPKVMPLPAPEPNEKNEWTTVQKKPYRPKKKVEHVDEPQYDDKFEHLAQDQESLWG
jgi:hypothetical protein|uniref:Uncharacterized protein n=1 Tax=viral metagenome TaxID=1070528 RepID=A0A6C0B199_9ZZZZ